MDNSEVGQRALAAWSGATGLPGLPSSQSPHPALEPPCPVCTTPLEEEGGQEGFGQSQPHSVASAHLHSCPWSHCRLPTPRASCQTHQATAVLYSGLKKREKKNDVLVITFTCFSLLFTLKKFTIDILPASHQAIQVNKGALKVCDCRGARVA